MGQSFPKIFKDQFESVVRSRGSDYFRHGCVKDVAQNEKSLTGKVIGGEEYEVNIQWEVAGSQHPLAQCNCLYYKSGFFCKHLWAFILKIDSIGLGQNFPVTEQSKLNHLDDPSSDGLKVTSVNKVWLNAIQDVQTQTINIINNEFDIDSRSAGIVHSPLYYALDLSQADITGALNIEFFHQLVFGSIERSDYQVARLTKKEILTCSNPEDREILPLILFEGQGPSAFDYFAGKKANPDKATYSKAYILNDDQEVVLRKIAQTGRLIMWKNFGVKGQYLETVKFDPGAPWQFQLNVELVQKWFKFSGKFRRRDNVIELDAPTKILKSGIMFIGNHIHSHLVGPYFPWITALRNQKVSAIPEREAEELLEVFRADPACPLISWPENLKFQDEIVTPIPKIKINDSDVQKFVNLKLMFIYGEEEINIHDRRQVIIDIFHRKQVKRDMESELEVIRELNNQIGAENVIKMKNGSQIWRVPKGKFAEVVSFIFQKKWPVEVYGKKVHKANRFNAKVTSGVDWFELSAQIDFASNEQIELPKLLASFEENGGLVELKNGEFGLVPEELIRKYVGISKLGKGNDNKYRFSRAQGALLATWLEEGNQVSFDSQFSNLKAELAQLKNENSMNPSKNFKGTLRPYQKQGLSWLWFLRKTGFGGIIADDMGLGKTIQVLALLDFDYNGLATGAKEGAKASSKDKAKKKTKDPNHAPSLVIVPKSLLFNWQEECEKFSPDLKVLLFTGDKRQNLISEIKNYDIVLITYSTLRQEIEKFAAIDFNFVIVDEAQAIKNPDSMIHKACVSLKGRHRLAMTGTPIENSVDDLVSILDFVSPGLVGVGFRSKLTRATSQAGRIDSEILGDLSSALRPFILRRTKSQVLKELPDKIEKTLVCELGENEWKNYVELRDHFRGKIKNELSMKGLGKSKIIVLEALLRLRQAACHPGLIDKTLASEESSKVDVLLENLKEIIAEDHKAVVFSQFTSFLDIVEEKFNRDEISYERLDGTTSLPKRKEVVDRFQTDPKVKVFLVSLKAGGVGLNLTAADYVFILDPWWNPAIESQAIDRTHRIGQKNKVIAYRLIAKNTVEEKIIDLQKTKKKIADAIITADQSLLQKMSADDIENLLS